MTLKEKITADLLAAMKAKEEKRLSALRLLKAAIMKFEVSGNKKKEASDEETMQIIGREVKQRKDSVEAYKKGGRDDLAQKEEAEMKILQAYLPEQMGEEELKKIIQEVMQQTGISQKAEFGKLMAALMPRVKGKAEGSVISKMAGQLLK